MIRDDTPVLVHHSEFPAEAEAGYDQISSLDMTAIEASSIAMLARVRLW